MHIRQQILQLLLIERLPERWHFAATQANDLPHSIVIGRQTAYGQVLLLEDSFEPGPLFAARGIRFMALVTMPVIDTPPGGLLRVETKFRIGLPPLHVAAGEAAHDEKHGKYSAKAKPQRACAGF
jgi:hypothetical protein